MNTNTDIIVILDRSGSMSSLRRDVEGGFDSFIAEQRKLPDPCLVTLTQFDTDGIELVYERKALADVPALQFVPRGGTPLLDAVGKTITSTLTKPHAERVLVVIITDGQENASREWTKAGVKSLIEQQQKAGWAVIFLAANVDAFAEAGALGVAVGTTSSYPATAQGVTQAFATTSRSAQTYRGGGSADLTDEERKKLGGGS